MRLDCSGADFGRKNEGTLHRGIRKARRKDVCCRVCVAVRVAVCGRYMNPKNLNVGLISKHRVSLNLNKQSCKQRNGITRHIYWCVMNASHVHVL